MTRFEPIMITSSIYSIPICFQVRQSISSNLNWEPSKKLAGEIYNAIVNRLLVQWLSSNTQIAHEDKLESTYHPVTCRLACICYHIRVTSISSNPSVRAVKIHFSRAFQWRTRSRTSRAQAHLPVSTKRSSVKKKKNSLKFLRRLPSAAVTYNS